MLRNKLQVMVMSNNSESSLIENQTSKESELLTQAQNLAEKQQWADVIKTYKDALKINPDNARAYQGLGDAMIAQEMWEDAIAAYQEAIAREADLFTAYHKQGDALIKLEKWEEAEATFKKALELKPNFHWLHYQLGEALAGQKKWADATAPYRRCLKIKGDFLYGYQKLGKCLLELHQWEEAQGCFERAIALEPDYHWAHYSLGEALVGQKDWEGAVAAFEKAIDIKPDLMFGHHKLGDALFQLERYPEAVKAYSRAIELNPDFTWGHYKLGDVLVELEEWEGAVEAYRKFMQIQPGYSSEVEEKLNLVLDRQAQASLNSYKQAIENDPMDVESYQKALKIKPDDGDLYLGLANAWYQKSEYKKAIDTYQQILQIKPYLMEVEENAIIMEACWQALKPEVLENEKTLSLNHYECVGNRIKGRVFGWRDLTDIVTLDVFINKQKITEVICNNLLDFSFRIPDEYLDGKEYELEIQSAWEPQKIYKETFNLQLKGNIDVADDTRIEGWIVDTNSPQNSLELDVYVNGLKSKSIVANLLRDDVGYIFGFSKLGFFVNLSEEKLRGKEIALTLKDSSLPILNTPILAISQEAKTQTISLLNQKVSEFNFLTNGEKQWLTKMLFPNLKKLTRHQQENELKFLSEKKYHQLSLWHSIGQEVAINVVVPVYKNLEVTKKCLERLIKAKRNRPYQIIVINDCSPDPEIHTYLDELANLGKIKLIKHAENEGFVKSVNNGMKFDMQSDVVLLNSDAYVTDYWLDYLGEAVYKDERIATGTPFSNNATIFSYPINCQETENIPKDITLEELAQICQQVNQNVTIEVPSGHGFCLYIRRDALREVGYFDAETWGKGYGEEVDWCQQALDLGWRHIAVPSVFIQHVGSQSFTGDKTDLLNRSLKLISEKYPEYDLAIQEFIKLDALAAARRNIDLARLKRCGDRFLLTINHNLGGGTEKHLQDLVPILELENIISLILKPDRNSEDWVELTCPKLELLARYDVNKDWKSLIKDLQYLGVFHVHIHHTIGFSKNFLDKLLKGLALSYDVTLHDYASICPRVTLSQSEGKYCQEPPVEVCELCIKDHGVHRNLLKVYEEINSVKIWRSNSENLLKAARKIFVPSQDAAARMSKYFPQLEFTVRYHPEVVQNVTLRSQNDDESTIRVGLIGGISEIKGLKTFYDCASYADRMKKDVEFIVIGTTAKNSLFEKLSNVTIYGAYKPEELNELIRKSKLDFAAFFSTWPETYCYTLSEALENGLYPFAFDIGAVAERVRQLGVGYLIEPDVNPASLLEALYSFASQCRQQEDTVNIGNNYSESFLKSYYLFQNIYL